MDVAKSLSKAAAALTTATVLVKDAQDEYPGLAPQLEACNTECKRAKRLVDLTRKHKGLHTAGVMPMAEILLSAAEDIQEHIGSLDSDQDSQPLADLRDRLQTARRAFGVQIQSSCVGLSKAHDGTMVVDAQLLQSTNEAVKLVLGQQSGLHIATFLAKRMLKADARGKIHLSQKDYDDLCRSQIKTTHPETRDLKPGEKVRITSNCLAKDQSLQFCGPIGVDILKDVAVVKTEGLVSKDRAIQVGYAATMEVFDKLLAVHQASL